MGVFPKLLSNFSATVGDFTVTDHQLLTTVVEYTTIATYKCPAQQKIAPGSGVASLPDSCGYLYISLTNGVDASPVEILGKIRLIVTNFAGTKIATIGEWDESILHGSLTDRKLKLPLPERKDLMFHQDSYLKVQVMPLVVHQTGTTNADNLGWGPNTAQQSVIQVPVTFYDNS
jgi:hypothetical protein